MLIISKNEDCIVNMDNICEVFLGADKTTIKVSLVDGNGSQLAKYSSQEIAILAFKKLCGSMNKSDLFKFPNEEELQKELIVNDIKWHHATGKKVKGHGES